MFLQEHEQVGAGTSSDHPRGSFSRDEDDEEFSSGSEGEGLVDPAEIDDTQEIVFEPDPPDEGIYGMAIASLVIDTRRILVSTNQAEKIRHITRLLLSIFIVMFTAGLQMYITLMTKFIVTPNAVRDLREAYSSYEHVMYDGHTELTKFGHHRGIGGVTGPFFNVTRFEKMDQESQNVICAFPLTQPVFLFSILLLWTLTCFRYIRKTLNFTHRILYLKTVKSMATSKVLEVEGSKKTVVGLTVSVKFFMILFIQLPCLVMNCLLLWIGCRWLVATLGFDELLLNAIALEFVLFLHELLYMAIVPYSMKQALAGTLVPYHNKKEGPNCCNMFGTFGLLILAIAWCVFYMDKLQQVLPDFGWDIAVACRLHQEEVLFV